MSILSTLIQGIRLYCQLKQGKSLGEAIMTNVKENSLRSRLLIKNASTKHIPENLRFFQRRKYIKGISNSIRETCLESNSEEIDQILNS